MTDEKEQYGSHGGEDAPREKNVTHGDNTRAIDDGGKNGSLEETEPCERRREKEFGPEESEEKPDGADVGEVSEKEVVELPSAAP